MSPPTKSERFAAYLKGFADDENRAALAALRRGLGKRPGEVSDPSPYVDPFLAPDDSPQVEAAYYLVATLFGVHQISWLPSQGDRSPRNFGASMERLLDGSSRGAVKRRFIALLNSHRDDLPEHLRHLVGLLKAKEVPIDWAQLLDDVRWWDSRRRSTQRRWARAFWRQAVPDDETSGSSGDATAADEDDDSD